jgi:glutamyl-tRNA synthetase
MNFVLIWLWVRRTGGVLRLRIDDCDTPRSKPEHMEDIFQSLAWMGMDWDEGPRSADEEIRIYAQALRGVRYAALTDQLIATGRVFACECSRKELQLRPCDCRTKKLSLDQPDTALRIETTSEAIAVQDVKRGTQLVILDKEMKDFVIRRRDRIPAYQIVSLADDIDQDINLIIRGEDLLTSTAAQLYLASLIGAEKFAETTFYHHPLLYNEQGQKLSKTSGSPSLKAMRESGTSPEQFYIRISELLDVKQKCTSLRELLQSDFVI